MRLVDLLGCRQVDDGVDRDDAAKSGNRVTGQCPSVSLGQVMIAGDAAWISVFNDGHGRGSEVAHRVPGGVQVKVVVEGQLGATELCSSADSACLPANCLLDVQRGLLMRILAVAQVAALLERNRLLWG